MNSKLRLALRISTMSFGIVLGALVILPLAGVARGVRAQNAPTEKLVYNFTPTTGQYPTGVINGTSGSFYIATSEGGSNQSCNDGCGNILKLSPPGKATELYAFTPTTGSGSPHPVALTRDAQGNLYGTTEIGGQYSDGSVFVLTSSGHEKTLHSFDPVTHDGFNPSSGVTIDSEGNLYGVTQYGGGTVGCNGGGCGSIYKVTPSGTETTLYGFTGGADGEEPSAAPILDSAGNLYGTAIMGGDLSCIQGLGNGCGTVWKLDTSGNFSVLYTFTGSTDGAGPDAGLVMDPSGNFYGAAILGGNLSCGFDGYGCGTVFKINSSGNFTVLYTFLGGPNDGQEPFATLLRDSAGNLYGTTYLGGDLSCSLNNGEGCGVVFKLAASGNETILHAFAGGPTDGGQPTSGALITDGKGNLYGTTVFGGASNGGVVFAVRAY